MLIIRILSLFVFLLLSACSGKSVNEGELKELPDSAKVTLDAPEEELYQSALELYQDQIYTVAIDVLKSLINNYPNGNYANFAKIKLIDCYYITKDFQSAARMAEDFIAQNPGSDSAPYAAYIAGRSYQLNYTGVGRDITTLKRAKEVYDNLIQDYPGTLYAETAEREVVVINAQLAEHYKYIEDFYARRELRPAAEKRAEMRKDFLNNNPSEVKIFDKVAQEGVDLQDASKLALVREPQKITLGDRYSYKPGQPFVMNLDCQPDSAILRFANVDYSVLRQRFNTLDSAGKNINLELGESFTQSETFSCGDLFAVDIAPGGRLQAHYGGELQMMVLDNPVRILMVLE